MSDQVGNTVAGWYPDPMQQGESRYWDGQAWTEHTAHTGAATTSATTGATAAAAGNDSQAWVRAKKWGVVVLIGGVLMALGALLPWETATVGGREVANFKGTSVGSGNTVLACGVIIAILAVLVLNRTIKWRAGLATLVLSIVGLILVSANASSINDDIDKVKAASSDALFKVEADTGIGLGLAIIGCAMAVVGSILLVKAARKAELETT